MVEDLLADPGKLPDMLRIDPVALAPGAAAPTVRVRPPGSKSLTNRAVLLASLGDGRSTLRRALLDADDARRMLRAVNSLGVSHSIDEEGTLTIDGSGGSWDHAEGETTLDLGNAGTATRFLAAASLLGGSAIVLDGNERMRARPIDELAVSLRELGAEVEFLGADGCPPMRVTPPRELPTDAMLSLGQTKSSQFLSALAMLGPFLPGGMTLRLTEPPTSGAYFMMTLSLLDRLGASVQTSASLDVVRISSGLGGTGLRAFDLEIEPDASGATYFWGAGALVEGLEVRVEGIDAGSLQSDSGFPELLGRMGARVSARESMIAVRGRSSLEPILADMHDMPDAAVTLAVVCAFASGPSVLRGVRTLRDKECDRIAALQTELQKVGVRVEVTSPEDSDTITITPPEGGIACDEGVERVEFETYDDHRIAMALSLVGLRRPNVVVLDPGCVAKTYPGYWSDFASLEVVRIGSATDPRD